MSVLGIEPSLGYLFIGILDSPLETFVYGLMKILVENCQKSIFIGFS